MAPNLKKNFILKLNNIEAKRTGSIVILYLKSQEKVNFRFFLNERQKTKVFDNELSKFCHSYYILQCVTPLHPPPLVDCSHRGIL